jgi:carboxypeptidase Taq
MIRFDLELLLLEDKLKVKDLSDAWNARYQSDLGVIPTHDGEGVLQDIHWFWGMLGGNFQGYTLGNLMSAQLLTAIQKSYPTLEDDIEKGDFIQLKDWLKNNIHQYGRKYTANEIIEKATGSPLSPKPFIDYIQRKYEPLYPGL